jgi:type IV pilus assembly protein PilX
MNTQQPPSVSMPLSRRTRQSGVALVVVLMFLLVITGLALFSARYATMGEGIARNQLDSERARQAAESALRDAERDLLLADGVVPTGALCERKAVRPVFTNFSAFSATCPAGQCAMLDSIYTESNFDTGANPEPWWTSGSGGLWNNTFANKPRGSSASCTFDGGVPIGTFTGAAAIAGVAQQPEYLIELVRRGSGRLVFFRITARGFGVSDRTQVVLQTYFQPFTVQ